MYLLTSGMMIALEDIVKGLNLIKYPLKKANFWFFAEKLCRVPKVGQNHLFYFISLK